MNRVLKLTAIAMVMITSFAFFSCDDDPTVIGLNDATKYGNISLKFEGTRPDGEDFTATQNFRFMPGGGPDQSSTVSSDGDEYHYFYVRRLNGSVYDPETEDLATLNLTADESGETLNLIESGLNVYTTIVTKDKRFFVLDQYISISEDDVTSYSYNAETGKLILKFTKTIPNGDTDLDGDLTITGNISVTVFEELFTDF